MIIYKYVDAATLKLILTSQRIGFAHPIDFNDPFDQPRVSREAYQYEYHSLFDNMPMTTDAQVARAEEAWGKCAVSSFTRTHDNVLMWAHYADKHAGAVIEIDASVAGLMSTELLIPVQFGSVIYMKRPNPDLSPARGFQSLGSQTARAGENRFEIDNYERLQRLFLTKSIPWSYEEEVRAVCPPFEYGWDDNGFSFNNKWQKFTKSNGRPIYCFGIEPKSIKRVYAGLRYTDIDYLREEGSKQNFDVMIPDAKSDGYEIRFHADDAS
jgi:hypothetical protein